MKRKLLVPSLAVAAAALLAGCVTGYEYRQGTGDYYYGQPSVDYYDDGGYYGGYGYGIPYGGYGYGGGWGLGFGYGGFPYWGYPYGYPYYGHHHRHHDGHDHPDPPGPTVTQTPRVGPEGRPRHLLRGFPPMMPEPAVVGPRLSTPSPARTRMPPPAPRVEAHDSTPPRERTAPRFEAPASTGRERDERRNSRH